MSGHTLLSPSGSHRWMICAAAPAAAQHLPESRGRDAALGTAKHACSYECLTKGIPSAAHFRGQEWEADGFKFKVDDEFIAHVDYYIAAVRREVGSQFYEIELNTSTLLNVPGQSGTADCVDLAIETETLTVMDAKFGFHEVRAQDNSQGLIYIGAARRRYAYLANWKRFRFVIVQPRLDHIDEAVYTLDELLEFERRAEEAARKVALVSQMQPHLIQDYMTPSPVACEWCPVRGNCPARSKRIAAMFPPVAEEAPEPPGLSEEDLGRYLLQVDDIAAWCKDIHDEARTRALAGKRIPGFKIVKGKRGARFFVDAEKARVKLLTLLPEEEVYEPRAVITPTEAEKRLKARGQDYAEIKGFVDQPEGTQKLVPESAAGIPIDVKPVQFAPIADISALI